MSDAALGGEYPSGLLATGFGTNLAENAKGGPLSEITLHKLTHKQRRGLRSLRPVSPSRSFLTLHAALLYKVQNPADNTQQ